MIRTILWVLLWALVAEAALGIVWFIVVVLVVRRRSRRDARPSGLSQVHRVRHRPSGHRIQL